MPTAAIKKKSYFQTQTVNRYVLDDGESFIEHKPLDEGTFQKYQDITSRVRLDKDGETSELDMAIGRQRHFLVTNLTTNWNLEDDEGKLIAFSVDKLLQLPPDVISGLYQDILKKNKILAGIEDDQAKKA